MSPVYFYPSLDIRYKYDIYIYIYIYIRAFWHSHIRSHIAKRAHHNKTIWTEVSTVFCLRNHFVSLKSKIWSDTILTIHEYRVWRTQNMHIGDARTTLYIGTSTAHLSMPITIRRDTSTEFCRIGIFTKKSSKRTIGQYFYRICFTYNRSITHFGKSYAHFVEKSVL